MKIPLSPKGNVVGILTKIKDTFLKRKHIVGGLCTIKTWLTAPHCLSNVQDLQCSRCWFLLYHVVYLVCLLLFVLYINWVIKFLVLIVVRWVNHGLMGFTISFKIWWCGVIVDETTFHQRLIGVDSKQILVTVRQSNFWLMLNSYKFPVLLYIFLKHVLRMSST